MAEAGLKQQYEKRDLRQEITNLVIDFIEKNECLPFHAGVDEASSIQNPNWIPRKPQLRSRCTRDSVEASWSVVQGSVDFGRPGRQAQVYRMVADRQVAGDTE